MIDIGTNTAKLLIASFDATGGLEVAACHSLLVEKVILGSVLAWVS